MTLSGSQRLRWFMATLGEIAQRLLGSSSKWREIVELNGIEDPDVVPVGTTLKLPIAR